VGYCVIVSMRLTVRAEEEVGPFLDCGRRGSELLNYGYERGDKIVIFWR